MKKSSFIIIFFITIIISLSVFYLFSDVFFGSESNQSSSTETDFDEDKTAGEEPLDEDANLDKNLLDDKEREPIEEPEEGTPSEDEEVGTDDNKEVVDDDKVRETSSRQSKKMLDYTGKPWSDELELVLKDVDFNEFTFNIDKPSLIQDVNSIFVLANKANYFPDDFVPINLVAPKSPYMGGGDRYKLRKVAADALDSLVKSASESGYVIRSVSAYRSISYQRDLFNYYVKKDGLAKASRYSSKPGHSEHHTGLCTDVSSPVMNYLLEQSYGSKPEGIWLFNNAHRFGFVIRYPKDKEMFTGYTYEPWHIRYFGVALATYLYETGLTYEEFIALQKGLDVNDIRIEN